MGRDTKDHQAAEDGRHSKVWWREETHWDHCLSLIIIRPMGTFIWQKGKGKEMRRMNCKGKGKEEEEDGGGGRALKMWNIHSPDGR